MENETSDFSQRVCSLFVTSLIGMYQGVFIDIETTVDDSSRKSPTGPHLQALGHRAGKWRYYQCLRGDTTMSIMKQLKQTGWFYLETLVDAMMERLFSVYSYPEPSPVPHPASASLAEKECKSHDLTEGEIA